MQLVFCEAIPERENKIEMNKITNNEIGILYEESTSVFLVFHSKIPYVNQI